jgi:hypothetical protein
MSPVLQDRWLMMVRSALFGVLMLWGGTVLLLPSAILAVAGATEEEQRDLSKSQPSEEVVSSVSPLHRVGRRVEARFHGSASLQGASPVIPAGASRGLARGPDSRVAALGWENGCGARLRC